ncbi:hypothetical protein [Bradyrhizobium sp. USDA 10063]
MTEAKAPRPAPPHLTTGFFDRQLRMADHASNPAMMINTAGSNHSNILYRPKNR